MGGPITKDGPALPVKTAPALATPPGAAIQAPLSAMGLGPPRFALAGYRPAPPWDPSRPRPSQPVRPKPTVEDPVRLAFPRGPGRTFGEDDRVAVLDATAAPWRGICALRITSGDGRALVGTGWFVGPRTVITAGHCLYLHHYGGPARQVEVIPALSGPERPYDSVISTDFDVLPGWRDDADETQDYGAIFLPDDRFAGNKTFALGHVSVENLAESAINICGYPKDRDDATRQYYHGRVLADADEHALRYETDTWGGQSGSPIWIEYDGYHLAVGIHTTGGPQWNSGVRINETVLGQLVAWRNRA